MLDIREERFGDYSSIYSVTELAFRDMPFSEGDEQDLIDSLRSEKALILSLVAVLENQVIGNVVFSPATLSDESGPWFALGPVSVLPQYQSKSVGSTLINKGLESIKRLGALGCILTGNPEYYQRFGFLLSPDNVPTRESSEYFMVKIFGDNIPVGNFEFHDAFYNAA